MFTAGAVCADPQVDCPDAWCIRPSFDCYTTACGCTMIEFGSPAIPAIPQDFLAPGSQPVTGNFALGPPPFAGPGEPLVGAAGPR